MEILEHLVLVDLDLHDHFGIDLADPALARRPWTWLQRRIADLLARPDSRLHRALNPPKP